MPYAVPSRADREAWLARIDEAGAHDQIARDLACLGEVDVQPAPSSEAAEGWLRIAAWNIERGRDPSALAALLDSTGAQLVLLTEVDVGMGRTGNVDVAREIAGRLSAGSVYGVEFVELAHGKPVELRGVEPVENRSALHGNAIVSRVALERPEVIRLDSGGPWFTMSRGEPRVGGRCAVAATVSLDGVAVEVVSVHLESHSDADLRAEQMASLLDRVDARGTGPAVVGGDLNTAGAPLELLANRDEVRRMRAADPARFSWPVACEPLFDVAAAHGFEWTDANVAAPTTRHDPEAKPDHVPIRLDWMLVRGLEARRPVVVPALGPDARVLSDHELIAVSVRLPR